MSTHREYSEICHLYRIIFANKLDLAIATLAFYWRQKCHILRIAVSCPAGRWPTWNMLCLLLYSYFTNDVILSGCILLSILWCMEIVTYGDDIVSVIVRRGTGGYEGITLVWWMQYVMSWDQDSERMLVTVMTIQTQLSPKFPEARGCTVLW